ncbi:MAG: rhodanese-like domain-containing protein [Gemmiger sp.]|nr:rhodanese-like domain-containing protein [Gemmiger sp.]
MKSHNTAPRCTNCQATRRKTALALVVVAAALALTACATNMAGDWMAGATAGANSTAEEGMTAMPQTITPEEAQARLATGEPILVDVRREDEYTESHIPGAILIPNEEISTEMPAALPDKDAEIILYCRSGNRSAQAAKKLADMGYTNLYDLGGIQDWPYDTVSGAPQAAADTGEAAATGVLSAFTAQSLVDDTTLDQTIFEDYGLTMVNVWATFCGPCLKEMPDLGELSAEYAEKGVQVVGIVSDVRPNADGSFAQASLDNAKDLVTRTGAAYLHLLPSETLNSAVLKDIYAVPTTFFVDSKGNQVGELYMGARSKAAWAEIIDGLLAEGDKV